MLRSHRNQTGNFRWSTRLASATATDTNRIEGAYDLSGRDRFEVLSDQVDMPVFEIDRRRLDHLPGGTDIEAKVVAEHDAINIDRVPDFGRTNRPQSRRNRPRRFCVRVHWSPLLRFDGGLGEIFGCGAQTGLVENFENAPLLLDRKGLEDCLTLDPFGRHFIAAASVDAAQIKFLRGVEPEELGAADVDAVQRRRK
jgi:hypothetical protein